VRSQAAQFSHYTVRAALELARLIGEIVSCTGVASVAGFALAKSGLLAVEAEDLSYRFYRQAELEHAWRVTRQAWAHPDSRKLGLQARRLNPTLAKYTLAWGATVKRDALAQEAVRACGLNALTLSQKDSNVAEVERYLEARFPEDIAVLKRNAAPAWLPADVALTARSWTVARARGERLGGLEPAEVPGLDDALVQVEGARIAFDAAVAEIEKTGLAGAYAAGAFERLLEPRRAGFEAALEVFEPLLAGYQPTGQDGRPHAGMAWVKNEIGLRAVEAREEVFGEWLRLARALEEQVPGVAYF